MSKTLLVMRNEIISITTRKSFLFALLGIPLIAGLIFLGVSLLKGNKSGLPSTPSGSGGGPDRSELQVEGYVDQSGLISALPPDVPDGILVAYPDEASARRALSSGEINAYYVIPPDYVQSGDLIYVNPNVTPLSSGSQTWVMRATIFANLLGNDPERISRAGHPMDVRVKALATPKAQRDRDNPLTFYVPYATTLIFYIVIVMASSLLRNSTGNERKNRLMEILLTSVSPRELLTGKIIGLGIVGLLQTLVWMGTGYALLRLSGNTFNLPSGLELPFSILVWSVVFFLLGYAIYASLLAGLGALTGPNSAGSSTADFVIIWPTLIPLFLIVVLIESPNGALSVALSLFPLTAPIAMITRLAIGGVPFWQPLLAAGLMLIAAILVVRAVARLFQAQNMLSGQPFTLKRFFKTLLAQA